MRGCVNCFLTLPFASQLPSALCFLPTCWARISLSPGGLCEQARVLPLPTTPCTNLALKALSVYGTFLRCHQAVPPSLYLGCRVGWGRGWILSAALGPAQHTGCASNQPASPKVSLVCTSVSLPLHLASHPCKLILCCHCYRSVSVCSSKQRAGRHSQPTPDREVLALRT